MRTLRYTICSYIPDLHKPEEAYDFALVAAIRRKIILLGFNLSEHGLTAKDAITRAMMKDTPIAVINRVEAIRREADSASGYDVLRKLVADNRSSLLYGPIRPVKYLHRFEDAAMSIFASRVLKKVALRCKRESGSQAETAARSSHEHRTREVKFSTKCLQLAGS